MPTDEAPTLTKRNRRWQSPANYYAVLFWVVIIIVLIVFAWHPWHG